MGIEITEADREAAADLEKSLNGGRETHLCKEMRLGRCDDYHFVQAFARHRIAALQAREGHSTPAEPVAQWCRGCSKVRTVDCYRKDCPSAHRIATPAELGDAQFVAATPCHCADDEDENGNPIWSVEVQTIGGWSVVAKVWGGSPEQAASRAQAIITALAGKENASG